MRFALAVLAISTLAAQPDGDALLYAIRQKMHDNLARLPDYTCRLTIERSFGQENAKRLRPIDTGAHRSWLRGRQGTLRLAGAEIRQQRSGRDDARRRRCGDRRFRAARQVDLSNRRCHVYLPGAERARGTGSDTVRV